MVGSLLKFSMARSGPAWPLHPAGKACKRVQKTMPPLGSSVTIIENKSLRAPVKETGPTQGAAGAPHTVSPFHRQELALSLRHLATSLCSGASRAEVTGSEPFWKVLKRQIQSPKLQLGTVSFLFI